MTQPLTARQTEIYNFIVNRIGASGCPPTMAEIGKHLGIKSTNGITDHLLRLERKGWIVREKNKARSIRPLPIRGCCPLCGAAQPVRVP